MNKMTEQQFKKKLINRIILCAAIFVTGLALFLYATLWHGFHIPYDRKAEYIYCIFAGLAIGALAKMVILLVALKNQRLLKKRFITESDERNRQIALKAWAWAGYGTVFALLISTFFIPLAVMWYVYCMMCIPLVIFRIAYKIFQTKM